MLINTYLLMEPPINTVLKDVLQKSLSDLEAALDCDVLNYYGPIIDGNENEFLDIVEDLAKDPAKHEQLAIVLTTNGGSPMAVERYVNIVRKQYKKVIFIVPDYAYSAGTIFCMSGDDILMDYFSVLGPIDPQVQNKEGKFVPALGYLDKVNELLQKAKKNELTNAEFLILKDFDLAELRLYEQAKELTIDLLIKWLVHYKFKNWTTHKSTGNPVTQQEKEKRAKEIAAELGNNNKWKSHGRPINIEELNELRLKIEDYSDNDAIRIPIRSYYRLVQNYAKAYKLQIFIQTRKFL